MRFIWSIIFFVFTCAYHTPDSLEYVKIFLTQYCGSVVTKHCYNHGRFEGKCMATLFKLPTPLCDISGRLLFASLCFCKISSLLLGQMKRKPSPFGKTDSELLVGTGLWVLLKYKQTFSFNILGLHSFQTSDSILIQRLWRYISGMKNWLLYTTKFYLWFFFWQNKYFG